ncbi:LytTR family DNA-binding domain-containing protein [Anaerocolumna sp. AGMB13025]|uniref:LytR/AlgR family response regulator transcription factor n=1 Tax=Anaerocolumna sp. AGMB13025 TaxID=3039116 RepID=UPI00241D6AA6|nr:LytTR family DNA-binding domain-containing protein [Anaerocolumna sp. AGMB13025]WFR56047.1 LytTR family DNA-binding domain-containing protein [Anaerocolumna sp. AGMB13025]
MVRIAICDDEHNHRLNLRNQINYYSIQRNIEFEVEEFSTPEGLLRSSLRFDLLFLDIYLNTDKNGVEYGKILREMGINIIIVFFSSSREYSIEGYTVGAFRYLVKPIGQADLTKTMDSFLKNVVQSTDRISITSNNSEYYININDIIYIESLSRKRLIYVCDYAIETWETLVSLYNKLPKNIFMYPHKCFIVNINFIKYFNNYQITMNNGNAITLGRKYYKDFKHKLHTYFGDHNEN